jgi:hypothetical protein
MLKMGIVGAARMGTPALVASAPPHADPARCSQGELFHDEHR